MLFCTSRRTPSSSMAVKSGVNEGDEVVSGSYRAISRELENDSIVRVEEKHGNNGQGMAENNEN